MCPRTCWAMGVCPSLLVPLPPAPVGAGAPGLGGPYSLSFFLEGGTHPACLLSALLPQVEVSHHLLQEALPDHVCIGWELLCPGMLWLAPSGTFSPSSH